MGPSSWRWLFLPSLSLNLVVFLGKLLWCDNFFSLFGSYPIDDSIGFGQEVRGIDSALVALSPVSIEEFVPAVGEQ